MTLGGRLLLEKRVAFLCTANASDGRVAFSGAPPARSPPSFGGTELNRTVWTLESFFVFSILRTVRELAGKLGESGHVVGGETEEEEEGMRAGRGGGSPTPTCGAVVDMVAW